jgi:hypothetical protein
MAAPKGNTYGAKSKLFEGALRKAVAQADGDALRKVADKLLEMAMAGEPWAVRELADRLDGKPVQQVDLQADVTTRSADELSDDELARIARGGLVGAVEAAASSQEPAGLH